MQMPVEWFNFDHGFQSPVTNNINYYYMATHTLLNQTLITLFKRDLGKLQQELGSYSNEAAIWSIGGQISNSAGNLTLHLLGNLNAFIGAVLGQTGYVRNREQEFTQKDIPAEELLARLEATSVMIENVLGQLTEEQLQAEYPLLVLKEKTTTLYFLVHLTTHLAYHLGQVNYHRRLSDKG